MPLRCLFHIHTWHSPDSLTPPRAIISRARKLGADVLIVTDHESIRGAESAMRLASGNPRFVVRGGEYKTEKGDVIGLFLKSAVRSRRSTSVADEIHSQGGLVVLPHPYKGHRLDAALLEQADLIETFNGRCTAEQNRLAQELARRLNKPELAGSDAHSLGEISTAVTEFHCDGDVDESDLPEIFRTAPRTFHAAPASRIYQPYSGLIKACRTFDALLFGYHLKRIMSVAWRERFS